MAEHHERRQSNEQMASDIGYMRGLLEGLAGPEGRVTKLEKSQDRQWWLTVAIGPALAILHQGLRKFGVNV